MKTGALGSWQGVDLHPYPKIAGKKKSRPPKSKKKRIQKKFLKAQIEKNEFYSIELISKLRHEAEKTRIVPVCINRIEFYNVTARRPR